MLGTVIVGFDGSDSARDALALAEVLTEHVRTDLIAARVFPWEPEGGRSRPALAEVEEAAHAVGGRAEVVAGDVPAAALQDLAVAIGADLLVVGQVGLRLLHGAPCAVAVAPRGFARRYAPDVRTIAAGYDCSDEAEAGLAGAAELARTLSAHLRVIAVAGGDVTVAGRLAEALASLPREIDGGGVLRHGDPADILVEEASRETDLLVLGSRRCGPAKRAALGSVSTELVRRAACAVLVIPGSSPADFY